MTAYRRCGPHTLVDVKNIVLSYNDLMAVNWQLSLFEIIKKPLVQCNNNKTSKVPTNKYLK